MRKLSLGRDTFSSVPVFLNVDHTHSLEKTIEAAKSGFDSIVVDFSALPSEQNVASANEAVEAIKAIDLLR